MTRKLFYSSDSCKDIYVEEENCVCVEYNCVVRKKNCPFTRKDSVCLCAHTVHVDTVRMPSFRHATETAISSH